MRVIRFNNFYKYLTCQPYFVFNDLNSQVDRDNIESEDFEWDIDSAQASFPSSPSEIIARTFSIIDNYLIKKLQSDHPKSIIIKPTLNLEEKISQTSKYITDGYFVISPVFKYENAISTPFAFDSQKGHIFNISYSSKTKRRDFLKAFYDYQVIKNNHEVHDYFLYLPKNKDYKKGEIDLYPINKLHTQVSGDIPGELTKDGEEKQIKVMPALEKGFLTPKNRFPQFNTALKAMNSIDEFEEFPLSISNADVTFWGTNQYWSDFLERINHEHAGFNGKVISKKKIVNKEDPSLSKVYSIYSSLHETEILDRDKLKRFEELLELKQIVWYDFEGFSLPISPLDHVKPYNQIIFQVSVIITDDNKEIFKENIVFDPLKISIDDLYKVIEHVYQNKKDAYVVYNKNYELARMKEILRYLELDNYPELERAISMFQHIQNNTFDLADIFIVNSSQKLPGILLNDQKCRYSIKNIEKHITQNNIDLPRKIFPYKELEIKNGVMAMEVGIKRALNLIGDSEWEKYLDELKKYCENDVRAMIMVYDFINKLLSE